MKTLVKTLEPDRHVSITTEGPPPRVPSITRLSSSSGNSQTLYSFPEVLFLGSRLRHVPEGKEVVAAAIPGGSRNFRRDTTFRAMRSTIMINDDYTFARTTEKLRCNTTGSVIRELFLRFTVVSLQNMNNV